MEKEREREERGERCSQIAFDDRRSELDIALRERVVVLRQKIMKEEARVLREIEELEHNDRHLAFGRFGRHLL